MREMHIADSGAADAVVAALRHDVVMLQMPTVFVLLAPPNRDGVAWLDRTKTRLPAKNYGTALGDLARFHRLALPGALPPELDSVDGLRRLTGAFIRFAVGPDELNTPMVRGGTHQGLLLEGPHRTLFQAIEAGLAAAAEPPMIGGQVFTAPLCTSANVSGHPDGSITSWERAREFGQSRDVPLVVRCDPTPEQVGSYPIFWLRRDRISVERDGPGMAELKAALPARLFAD
jgi:tRNA A37 threonylcarbamoyladenosine synthetase subunit TsaC/SUA5/YrdC